MSVWQTVLLLYLSWFAAVTAYAVGQLIAGIRLGCDLKLFAVPFFSYCKDGEKKKFSFSWRHPFSSRCVTQWPDGFPEKRKRCIKIGAGAIADLIAGSGFIAAAILIPGIHGDQNAAGALLVGAVSCCCMAAVSLFPYTGDYNATDRKMFWGLVLNKPYMALNDETRLQMQMLHGGMRPRDLVFNCQTNPDRFWMMDNYHCMYRYYHAIDGGSQLDAAQYLDLCDRKARGLDKSMIFAEISFFSAVSGNMERAEKYMRMFDNPNFTRLVEWRKSQTYYRVKAYYAHYAAGNDAEALALCEAGLALPQGETVTGFDVMETDLIKKLLQTITIQEEKTYG